MSGRVLGLVVTWIVLIGLLVAAPRLIPATGDGFTRGANRLPLVLALHALAFVVAVASAALSYRARAELNSQMLRIGFMPLSTSLVLLVLVFIALLRG